MRLLTGILLVCFAGFAVAEDKTEWTTVLSKKGKYEVAFPGKVTEKDVEPAGLQTILEAEGGKAVYMTQVNLYPAAIDPTDKTVVSTTFKAAQDAVIKALGDPKIASEKTGTFDKKFPMKEVDLEVKGLGIYRTKWIITEKGFYQLVVAGPKEFVEGKDAKKFMDSFKFKSVD